MLLAQGGVDQRKGESKGNEGNEYDRKDHYNPVGVQFQEAKCK